MKRSVLLATALLILSTSTQSITHAASNPPASKDYTNGVRVGGWLGDRALLVLPDRNATAVSVGKSFGSTKLLAIGNTDYTIETGGKQMKGNLDMAWQIAPNPDLTNWLISYMNVIGKKLDLVNPDLNQETTIRVYANGSAPSNLIKVNQAVPFDTLPEYLESVDLKIKLTPHQPTVVEFVSMKITQAAYDRLGKSPYAAAAAATSAKQ